MEPYNTRIYEPSSYQAPSLQQEWQDEQTNLRASQTSYSTRHTLAFNHNLASLRGSATPSNLGLALLMNSYEDTGYKMLGEFTCDQQQQSSQNFKQYQKSQLQAMVTETPPLNDGYFFESPSKYISLKQYKQQTDCYTTHSTPPISLNVKSFDQLYQSVMGTRVFDAVCTPSQQPRYAPAIKSVKDWFERLSLHDKSIVLTVVDKQLVNLIFNMFKVYSQEGNVKFFPQPTSGFENDFGMVKNYNLLYKKQHTQYQQQQSSAYLKKILEAENALVSNVRLLNINEVSKKVESKKGKAASQDEQMQQNLGPQYINNFNALTLELSFFKNPLYFFEIMRLANQKRIFLGSDMIMDKEVKRLEQSVFYNSNSIYTQFNTVHSNYQPTNAKQNPLLPQKFYTFIQKNEINDGKGLTLGQCLLLIFEKAINVQYHDYLNKLDLRHQSYFFLSEAATINNIFVQDQLLTNFWANNMTTSDRELAFKQIDEIEKEMRALEHQPVKGLLYQRIKESSNEEDEEDSLQNKQRARKRLQMILSQDEDGRDSSDEEVHSIGGSIYYPQMEHRIKGIASSKMRIQSDEEGDILDNRSNDDNDVDFDLENQRRPAIILGRGAVGKLKALKSNKSKGLLRGNGSENEYEDDFESNEEDDDSYQLNYECKYNKNFQKQSSTKLTKQQRDQLIDTLENPLTTNNKFFFVRQQLIQFRNCGTSDHHPFEYIEMRAFEFMKTLSTFICLETVLVASNMGKQLNFSSNHLEEHNGNRPVATSNAHSIPIKQRLYQYLIKLEENARYDLLLKDNAMDENTNSSGKGTKQQSKSNTTEEQQKAAKNKKKRDKKKKNEIASLKNELDEIKAANIVLDAEDFILLKLESQLTPTKNIVDISVLQQIKQEDKAINLVKLLMLGDKKRDPSDMYHDSLGSQHFPDASLISKGLNEMSQADQIKSRHQEERRSLLTGVILHEKYKEEYVSDPTTNSSLLLNDPTIATCNNEDVEMNDESKEPPQLEGEAPKKKKRNKKNKKNKKKKKQNLEEGAPINLNDIVIMNPDDSNYNHNGSINAVYENAPNTSNGSIHFELSQADKEFFEETIKLDKEIAEQFEEYASTEHYTQEISQNLIKNVIAAFIQDEKIYTCPLPPESKQPIKQIAAVNVAAVVSGKKGKNKKKPIVVQQIIEEIPSKRQKKMAKRARHQSKVAELASIKQKNAVEQEVEDEDSINEELPQFEEDNKTESQSQHYELNNENLILLQQQVEDKDNSSLLTPEKINQQSKKIVGFRMSATTPREQNKGYNSSSAEDNLKVPKRGLSRGSSGKDEKIHQDMIDMLGDLFPQEYKNPSDDTKFRISKITTSSSNSVNDGTSPDMVQKPFNKIIQFSTVSKFVEEPYPEPILVNQSKKSRKQQNALNMKNLMEAKQPKEDARISDTVVEVERLIVPAETVQSIISEISEITVLQPAAAQITPPPLASEVKGKKKAKQAEQIFPSVTKEMKERGAIVRPIDLENAAQSKKSTQLQQPQPKRGGGIKPPVEHVTSPPQIGVVVQRSQTPIIEQESMLLPSVPRKQSGVNNNGNNSGKQQQKANQGVKTQKQEVFIDNNRIQSKPQNANRGGKGKGGNNYNKVNNNNNQQQKQQTVVDQQQQQQPFDQQQLQQALFAAATQQQLLLSPPQQFNSLFPQSPGFFMPQANLFNNAFSPSPQGYFGNQDFSEYQANSFQTEQERSSHTQHTQTDETRILENLQQQQQQQFVMNQYQNIKMEFHPPAVANNSGFPTGIPNQFNYFQPSYPFGAGPLFDAAVAQQQQLQQQMASLAAAQNILLQNNFIPSTMNDYFNPNAQLLNSMFMNQQLNNNLMFANASQYPQQNNTDNMQPQKQPQPIINNPLLMQPVPQNHTIHNMINELLNQTQQMTGITQKVSHMSQEQYEEQKTSEIKEEHFYVKFDQEIYKLQNMLKMRLASTELERQSTLRRIEQKVRETYSECGSGVRVQMYGSMATGLAIDSSDMDLLISGVFLNDHKQQWQAMRYSIDRLTLVEQMKRLFRELTSTSSESNLTNDCIQDVQFIETASVPVIKLIINLQQIRDQDKSGPRPPIDEDMRLLKVDITFNDQNVNTSETNSNFDGTHMSIKCCHFIKERLSQYPLLESITLVLKKFLALRNLNSPFSGGLNSYGLIILVLAFLNQNMPQTFSKDGTSISAARTLSCFLQFFGKVFDPSQTMINDQQYFEPHMNLQSLLIILDPLNRSNNIGKSTFNFDTIRFEFAKSHDSIYHMLQEFTTNRIEDDHQEEEKKSTSKSPSKGVYKRKLNILSKIIEVSDDNNFEQ